MQPARYITCQGHAIILTTPSTPTTFNLFFFLNYQFNMGDIQDRCDCNKPDITIHEMCRGCGNAVSFQELRQQAINTYDRDDLPIEDPNLPRRHLRIGNPNNNLRVLHLDGGTSHVLSGTFERASITRLPPYEAVSYCWGGEDGDYTKSEFIIISGTLFPITKNCAAALLKVRQPRGEKVIWIDSLCINQNDVNERSVQVSQMGKIFSGAQKVHIYVGNSVDDGTASRAFYVLTSMRNLIEFGTRLRDRMEAVKTLFSQNYFSRMWIIQEVLLAKSAALHWGTETVPWQTLSADHLAEFKRYRIDSCIPEWMRIRATSSNFRNSETLGELLFSAMGSTASNDRDKVYGIYGLLFDAEEEGLTVDYGLSAKQVYTNMATHLIKKHSAFRAVLRHANHDAPLVDGEKLPSWVPDFRSRSLSPEVSVSDDGFDDLVIQSSVTLEESVSWNGTDELCLRGHKLVMSNFWEDSPTKYSGAADKNRKFQAKFQVPFDPEDHSMFWMPNGMLLQLKRNPDRANAYTLLGECDVKTSGLFSAFVAQSRNVSLADAMFGLELEDLGLLWNLCTHLGRVSPRYLNQFGLGSLKLPETSMEWAEAESVLNAHDFGTILCYNHTSLEPNTRQMLDFLRFCRSEETWQALTRLRDLTRGLKIPFWQSRRDINQLCLSWLDCYEIAEDLIRKHPGITSKRATLRKEFLQNLKAWQKTTERLSKPLGWAKTSSWPFKSAPRFSLRDRDGLPRRLHRTLAQGQMSVASVIVNNFDVVQFRFDQPAAAQKPAHERAAYVLEPWNEEWTETIQSIPHLLDAGAQAGQVYSMRSKMLRSGQKGGDLHVLLAETITLL